MAPMKIRTKFQRFIKLRIPRIVTVGTDFSGMGGGEESFRKLGVNHVVKFSCDNNKACEKLLKYKCKPEVFFEDILLRKPEDEPYVDVYLWAAPCQPFSTAGKGEGIADARGGPMLNAAMGFIERNKPRLTVMENVKGLTNKKNKVVLTTLVKKLKGLGYSVAVGLLNTKSYGVPQDRSRLYLVAVRKDSQRRDFQWPKPVDPLPIAHFLDRVSPRDKAGRLPKLESAKKLAKRAYEKAWTEKNADPLSIPVFVDIDCTVKFSVFGINEAKTITRGRGAMGGPWVSTRGRRTSIKELFRLQGYNPADFPWDAAGVTEHQMGAMIGNAMSLTVAAPVIAEGLWAAGLVSTKPCL